MRSKNQPFKALPEFNRECIAIIDTTPFYCSCGRAVTLITIVQQEELDSFVSNIHHRCGCGKAYVLEFEMDIPQVNVRKLSRAIMMQGNKEYLDRGRN